MNLPLPNKSLFRKEKIKAGGEIIAIDTCDSSLKIIRGSIDKGKIIVSGFAYKKVFSHDKEYSFLADKVKELLKECGLEPQKLKRSRIYTVIPGSEVCVRVLKLPAMPDDEIKQAVKAKIKEVVSYPLDEIMFDFSILEESQERGIKKINVVFMAIQKKNLLQHLDILKNAVAQPNLVTSPCFCAWNLIKVAGIGESTLSIIVASLGFSETDITVFREGKLIFTRNIPFGDRDFTAALKNELSISWEEAEQIKQECGLSAEGSTLKENFSPVQVEEILKRQAEVLFKELDLTAHHHYQITHGESIDKYIFLGSGAKLKGLIEFLRKRLDLPVEEIKLPQDKLEVTSERKAEFQDNLFLYYQGLGAMLANFEDINLASCVGAKSKNKFAFAKLAIVPSLASKILGAVVSLAIIFAFFLKFQNFYYHNQIKQNKAKWESFSERRYKIVQLKKGLEHLSFKKNLYSQLESSGIFYPEIIAAISKSIPEGKIFLNSLEFTRQPSDKIQVTLTGRVEDPTFSATNFMLILEKTGYFANLSLVTSGERDYEISRAGELNFNIKGEVRVKR